MKITDITPPPRIINDLRLHCVTFANLFKGTYNQTLFVI